MKAYVDRCFLNHCLALACLARVRGPVVSRIAAGAELLGKLRRLEARGARLALRLCNGPEYAPGEVEREKARIADGARAVLNGATLPGLFVNGDPRGYAVKLARGKAAPALLLLSDWGGDFLLAPDFAGRS